MMLNPIPPRKAASLILIALAATSMFGCSTTDQALSRMSPYINQNADMFFRANGMPLQAFQFQNGDKVYRWSSANANVYMPAFTTFSGNVDSMGFISGSAHTTGGFTANLQCVLDIHTDKTNKVIRIVPIVDTWGKWETSRCNEALR